LNFFRLIEGMWFFFAENRTNHFHFAKRWLQNTPNSLYESVISTEVLEVLEPVFRNSRNLRSSTIVRIEFVPAMCYGVSNTVQHPKLLVAKFLSKNMYLHNFIYRNLKKTCNNKKKIVECDIRECNIKELRVLDSTNLTWVNYKLNMDNFSVAIQTVLLQWRSFELWQGAFHRRLLDLPPANNFSPNSTFPRLWAPRHVPVCISLHPPLSIPVPWHLLPLCSTEQFTHFAAKARPCIASLRVYFLSIPSLSISCCFIITSGSCRSCQSLTIL